MNEENGMDVKIGQMWADNDKRTRQRRFTIVAVDEKYALCRAFRDAYGEPSCRSVRIRLDRFKPTSTGYRLIERSEGA